MTGGVEERFAGPQGQAGRQQLVGLGELGRVGRSAQRAGIDDGLFEALGVDRPRWQLQAVAAGHRDDNWP